MCTAYNDRYGLEIIGLRYMNVYGPHQDQTAAYTGVIPIMLNKIDANEAPTINGDGSQAYDFIDAWLADSSAEYILTEWGYGHSNGKVMDAIGEENGFGSLESYSNNTLCQSPTDPALRERMIKEWVGTVMYGLFGYL